MSERALEQWRQEPFALAAGAIAVVGLGAISGALFFQYGMGLAPCPLCLEQRVAYYVAIPLAAMVMLGVSVGASRKVLIAALAAIALAMLWNAGLGAYHAGVEWKWWEGPRDCSGPVNSLGAARDMLRQIETSHIVRCDEAAWRFLGLSLAGYNVLISLALAALAAWGVIRGRSYGSSSVSQYR